MAQINELWNQLDSKLIVYQESLITHFKNTSINFIAMRMMIQQDYTFMHWMMKDIKICKN